MLSASYPHRGKDVTIRDDQAGKIVRCSACRGKFHVKEPEERTDEPVLDGRIRSATRMPAGTGNCADRAGRAVRQLNWRRQCRRGPMLPVVTSELRIGTLYNLTANPSTWRWSGLAVSVLEPIEPATA
jgi:hypothetical protein